VKAENGCWPKKCQVIGQVSFIHGQGFRNTITDAIINVIIGGFKMNLENLIHSSRDEILSIASRHGARKIFIFGSVARGEAGPDSDIDFLVEMEPGSSLFDLGGLLFDLQQTLGVDVDVVTVEGLRPRIREKVLADAIEL
jgi:predicted nucleotidyltransferase